MATIKRLIASIEQRSRGSQLLLTEDFNTDVESPEENIRGEEIMTAIAFARL